MKECEECKEKLGIFEGYYHSALGKNNFLCSSCFDKVSLRVEKWSEFVLSNSFNNEASKNNLQLNWNNVLKGFNQIQRMTGNALNQMQKMVDEVLNQKI